MLFKRPKIFVSYRRREGGHAGWLIDRLINHFGRDRIFKDLKDIKVGENFVEKIDEALADSAALVAIIGQQWLTVANDNERKIDQAEDYVRLEIVTALNKQIHVIPVLVQGATMPRKEELPDALEPLLRLNALQIRDERWDDDVELLIEALKEDLRKFSFAHQLRSKIREYSFSVPYPRALAILGGIALLVGGLLIIPFLRNSSTPTNTGANTANSGSNISNDNSTPRMAHAVGLLIPQHAVTNWSNIDHSFFSFVLIKATDGSGRADDAFARNWREAKSKGFIKGAYHFFRFDRDPINQANLFAETVHLESDDLPPILDVEGLPDEPAAGAEARVRTWLQLVEQLTGRKPIIYTYKSFWDKNVQASFADYPLWVADFKKPSPKNMPNGWASWTFWHYSSSDISPGSQDTQLFNGSYEDLRKFIRDH